MDDSRSSRVYELTVRQEPKHARMCGVGGMFALELCISLSHTITADRRPIDPPPIVQLRVVDPARKNLGNSDDSEAGLAPSFLQNPYYFMFASLAKPDDDTELHWLKVGFLVLPL